MRRIIALALAGAALAALTAAPAVAGKGKHVHGSFGATLAPLPNLSSHTGTARPGCTAGVEGVHYVAHEVTAPGKGTLRFYAEGFQGDHDLYVFSGENAIARSDQAQVPDGAAPEEEVLVPLKKGQTVTLVACNWLGQPNVEAHYEGAFK